MSIKTEKLGWFTALVLCVALGITGCDGGGGNDKINVLGWFFEGLENYKENFKSCQSKNQNLIRKTYYHVYLRFIRIKIDCFV